MRLDKNNKYAMAIYVTEGRSKVTLFNAKTIPARYLPTYF